MYIETVEDLLDELANKLGIYGSCKVDLEVSEDGCENQDPCCCRQGFIINYTDRFRQALINEQKLERAGI